MSVLLGAQRTDEFESPAVEKHKFLESGDSIQYSTSVCLTNLNYYLFFLDNFNKCFCSFLAIVKQVRSRWVLIMKVGYSKCSGSQF